MKVKNIAEEEITVSMTTEELAIINNALNEVCHALDTADFQTRMGGTLAEAQQLLAQIAEVLGAV